VSHPPKRRQLLVAGAIGRIVSGLDLREPLHANGVDLRDPVFEGRALNVILYLAITQGAFECDEVPLLKRPGELREIAPSINTVPFGAGFVVSSPIFSIASRIWSARDNFCRLCME
jgi:hypothetical protein